MTDMQHMHHPDPDTTTTTPGGATDTTGVHGMLLVGTDPVYLSHLPMFAAPHNYQVLLKVALEGEATGRLHDFRAHFGSETMFTVAPEPFAIRDLVDRDPVLTEFRANVHRGHFERGGDVIAEGTLVRVEKVVHFDELPLEPTAEESARGDLEYLIFGDAERELFLAHSIAGRPDFDQVLLVRVSGAVFTETELDREGRPTVVVPGRPSLPDRRLQAGESVAAHSSAGQHFHTDVQVEVLAELYLEQDDLR